MLLLQKMMMFFLIMLIGYICRKSGVFKDTTGKTISSIVINIGNPALIIASGMNPERLENKGKLLFTLGVALIYFAIMSRNYCPDCFMQTERTTVLIRS